MAKITSLFSPLHCFRLVVWSLLLSYGVCAFKFVHSEPAHCSNISFHWTGGSPPFHLLIISPLQPIRNISIPESAFNPSTQEGNFITQLLFQVHDRVMFTISDATGITAGGLTPLLTVADSKNLGCNTTSPVPDFFFSLNKDLLECQPYEFSLYPNATQPLTVMYFVPNGEFFQITAPMGDTFSWRNNLTAGTEVIFGVKDSLGRDGGTSGSKVVITSGDTSCLRQKKSDSSRNIAAAVGGVVGGLVGLILIASLFWFFMRRRRRARRASEKGKLDLTYDVIGGTLAEDNELIPHPYIIEPLVGPTVVLNDTASTSKSRLLSMAQTSSQHLPTTSASSPRYSEFSLTGSSSMYTDTRTSMTPSQRVIVHTDISEAEGPVELPPQYSDRRAPIPGLIANVESLSPSASISSEPTSPRPRKS